MSPFYTTASFIYPGSYNGAPAKVGGVDLTERRAITVSTSGAQHVYLKLTYNLTTTESGYVYASELQTAEIIVQAELQETPMGPSTGEFFIIIASFSNGRKTAQFVSNSLNGAVCDAGGDGLGNLHVEVAG